MKTIFALPDYMQAKIDLCVGEGNHRIKDTKVLGGLKILRVLKFSKMCWVGFLSSMKITLTDNLF